MAKAVKAKAPKKTTEKVEVKKVNLQGVVEDIKSMSFEDRKTLAVVVSHAHSKDLEKAGGGMEPDGELYKL